MEIDAGARGLPGENAICTGGDGAWRLIRVRTRGCRGKRGMYWRGRRVETDAGTPAAVGEM